MNKLCLVMIVKNEEKIILRCLESVVGIVDCYSIVDTGSTDNTKKVIEDFFFKHKIKGGVYRREWKNFGHNRSEAFGLAKDKAEYSLLIDADMVLKNTDFDGKLTADAYTLKQHSGNLVYQNTRIIKNSLNWKCIGATHEYWKAEDCFNMTDMPTLQIMDVGDGGSKADKYQRDIALLLQGIEEEPDNGRYMFYLANSFRDTGNYDKAIEWYTKKINTPGWDEEIWHAMYQRALCRIWKRDDSLTIVNDLMMAVHARPWRLEPLYQLLRYLREMEMYMTGYMLGKYFGVVAFPIHDTLFIEKDVYDYRFYDEMSLAAFYSGHKEESKMWTEKAKDFPLMPQIDKDRIENNLQLITT